VFYGIKALYFVMLFTMPYIFFVGRFFDLHFPNDATFAGFIAKIGLSISG
jgi:hypothetical protein